MFANCEKFNQPVPFDTSNVRNMLGIFDGCKEFNQPINFDTSKVTGRREMFTGCHNLPLETQAKVELGISDVTRGEPGDLIAYGQRDHRGGNTENHWAVVEDETSENPYTILDRPEAFKYFLSRQAKTKTEEEK